MFWNIKKIKIILTLKDNKTMMNFIRFTGDLVGLGKKISSANNRGLRTQSVLKNVVGKVLNMAIMAGMLAGAIVYGIELICSHRRSKSSNQRVVTIQAA